MNEKLVHIIKVYPIDIDSIGLQPSFVKRIRKRNKYQYKSFSIYVKPLNLTDYRTYNINRYDMSVKMKLFNNNIFPIDISLKYIMKWPILVRSIIDTLFGISGELIDHINTDPTVMFKMLENRRKRYLTVEGLLDNLVLSNTDLSVYQTFRKLRTLEDRIDFAAFIETISGVIIEQRYEFANARKLPIKLASDKYFGTEYEKFKDQDGNDLNIDFNTIKSKLNKQMSEDKKYSEHGIKKAVDTGKENKELLELD